MGHSSGAHVAALVATDPRYLRRYRVPRRVIRGVVSLDTAALDVRPLANPGANEGARGIWSVFGTPEENAATGAWALASPLLHADRRDPPFLQVLAETARPGKVRREPPDERAPSGRAHGRSCVWRSTISRSNGSSACTRARRAP